MKTLIVLIVTAAFGYLGYYSYQETHKPSELSQFIDQHPSSEEVVRSLYE